MTTRKLLAAVSLGGILASAPSLSAEADWPSFWARWSIAITKAAGHEMEDDRWMHLHRGHPTAPDVDSVTLSVWIYGASFTETLDISQSGVELQYAVRGVPVSDWLAPSFLYTLRIDNPALNGLLDGFHDISVEARGPNRNDFKPHRAFLHITRGRPLEALHNEGIATGCAENPLRYCPGAVVSRAQMAVFITRIWNLPLP